MGVYHMRRRWPEAALLGALIAGTVACGGRDRRATDSGAAAATSAGTGTDSASAAPATTGAAPAAPAGAAAAAPITGRTVDVKMIGDAKGYRFEPANITIRPGDGVRWTMVSGGPHNVSFWADSIPSGAAAPLGANMPNTMGALMGPLLANANETYVVSFAGAKPGAYGYYCTPHLAMNMKAKITVQ